MVERENVLKILNEERNYEDKIVEHLTYYIENSLEGIEDLSEDEKNKLILVLSTISEESMIHSGMFTKLIERVLNG